MGAINRLTETKIDFDLVTRAAFLDELESIMQDPEKTAMMGSVIAGKALIGAGKAVKSMVKGGYKLVKKMPYKLDAAITGAVVIPSAISTTGAVAKGTRI